MTPLITQSSTSVAPFLGLFSTVFGSKQTRQPSASSPFDPCAPALVNTREHGGYAGTRVGEAQNPGLATHDGDWTVTEQPNAAHRQINEAGDLSSE